MTKTKDEILMVALGAKQFSSLERWQREQLYYAMDEWATQHKTAQLQQHVVMQVPQFEQILQVRLAELPYTKHLDDGQYNDGQAYGFECGARWAYEKLSSGTAVGNGAAGQSGSGGCRHRWWELASGKVLCDKCGVVKD